MNTPGAVLIFLPSWSLIFTLRRYLTQKPFFGMHTNYLYTQLIYCYKLSFLFVSATSKFCILRLHSQLPSSDQRKVFEPVPPGVRKVCHTLFNYFQKTFSIVLTYIIY